MKPLHSCILNANGDKQSLSILKEKYTPTFNGAKTMLNFSSWMLYF